MSSEVKDLIEFLRTVAKVPPKRAGMQYRCIEEMVLKEGYVFKTEGGQWPRSGEMEECFKNAYLLAMGNTDYAYCEGYAIGVIPVMHAWCCLDDGTVVDPTWENGMAYVGIPMIESLVTETAWKRRVFGVIDDWQRKWPLVTKFDRSEVVDGLVASMLTRAEDWK